MTNEQLDAVAHPWPDEGKLFSFRWRKGVWLIVRPWYEANNVDYRLDDIWFLCQFKSWFPFFSWNLKWRGFGIHGYIGWKPIPVALDPAFDWSKLDVAQKHIRNGELFVQCSMRGGVGEIS